MIVPKALAFGARELRAATVPRSFGAANCSAELLARLKRDGVVFEPFRDGELTTLTQTLRISIDQLQARRRARPASLRKFGDNQLELDPARRSEFFEALNATLTAHDLFSLAESYLRRKVSVRWATLQINDASDTHWRAPFGEGWAEEIPTNYMHVDTVVGVLKTIVYLSSVSDYDAGPLSYLPGSHRIPRRSWDVVIRRAVDHAGLSRRDRESRELFWALPKVLRRKADFGTDVLPRSTAAAELLSRERTYTAPGGGMVVFDGRGVHRGGLVRVGTRTIVQVALG
jgi:hypothetical protein